MSRWTRVSAALLLSMAVFAAACSSSSTNSSQNPGSPTGTPLKIALITSETGAAGSQFADSVLGFKAAIGAINAAGGADGHKVVGTVYDDQTSLTTITTVVQNAISDGNEGIVSVSPLFFLAAKYAQQAGIPVTGAGIDGSEWGTQPFTNMFASDLGSVDPNNPPGTGLGTFFKQHGGTVACAWGYGISPSSAQSANNSIWSALNAGLTQGVLDNSIPIGGVDFTAASLAAKKAGCNAVWSPIYLSSSIALSEALANAGVHIKVNVFSAGLDPSIIPTPAWSSVQGVYFSSLFRLPVYGGQAIKNMQAALKTYVNRPTSQFPTFNIYEGWLGVQLMALGVERAKSTTPAKVIPALRSVTNWTGGGLLADSIDYATVFGKGVSPSCSWYLVAKKSGFVPVGTKPLCGTTIKGKSGKVTP